MQSEKENGRKKNLFCFYKYLLEMQLILDYYFDTFNRV